MNPTEPTDATSRGPAMSKRRAYLLSVVLLVGVTLNADRIDHFITLLFGR